MFDKEPLSKFFARNISHTLLDIRELKKNGRGRQRRQNNKTNYRRQKAQVNMWNKADICAVLLSCETPIAPFPRCLQNVAIIVDLFVWEDTLKAVEFQRK